MWLTHVCVRYLLVLETLCLTVPFFFLGTGFTALQQGEDLVVRRRVGAQQEGGLGGQMVRTGVAWQPSAAASLAKEKKKKSNACVLAATPRGTSTPVSGRTT